jgi:hypothetical protein
MRQESFVGGGNHFTFATPSFSGSNYAINLDMMILERASGDVGAGFKIYRATSNDLHQGIALNLFPRSSYLSVASANQSLPRTEYTFPMNIETGKWYNVGLEVNNGFFNVFLDGSKVLSNMPTDLVRGYISLDTDDMKADFDNIGITAIPEPSPLALVAGGLVALTRMRKRKR